MPSNAINRYINTFKQLNVEQNLQSEQQNLFLSTNANSSGVNTKQNSPTSSNLKCQLGIRNN